MSFLWCLCSSCMQERGRQGGQMMGACHNWNYQLFVMTNLVLLASKVMSLYRFHTTCQQTVRFVPNHCGTCSGHPLHWSADVSLLLFYNGTTEVYALKEHSSWCSLAYYNPESPYCFSGSSFSYIIVPCIWNVCVLEEETNWEMWKNMWVVLLTSIIMVIKSRKFKTGQMYNMNRETINMYKTCFGKISWMVDTYEI
jgi:hypothetical protein